ncbi:MAG: hypothetical protein RLZZ272_260 [Actinomycetota bacterium]
MRTVTGPALPGPLDGHEVRAVAAHRAAKAYRCPECEGSIDPGVGHVVAWPEGRVDERRHWHRACWRVVTRRRRLA